jgi:TetR/AcrR family transcriptional repressor of bet genes
MWNSPINWKSMSAPEKLQVIEAPRRKASREERRQQFIEATIATLARNGYARTTLGEVAATAGLSHGLIIFHFETKEKLLVEALVFLAREYRDNWMGALAGAAANPAAQLDAMIRADFVERICNPARLGAWSALWGETQSRPLYQEYGATYDLEYADTIRRLCRELIAEGGYIFDPEAVARLVRVSLGGLWFDLMATSKPYPIEDALGSMFEMTMAFFPKHFDRSGAIRR